VNEYHLDEQNHQNSVISKWLLPELSFSHCWPRGTKTLGTRLGWAEFGYFLCYFKMAAPRALVFRPLVNGNEDSGNEIVGRAFSSLDAALLLVSTKNHDFLMLTKIKGAQLLGTRMEGGERGIECSYRSDFEEALHGFSLCSS